MATSFPQAPGLLQAPADTLPRGSQIDGQGGTLARRRYQNGALRLSGKKKKVWTLRWREDVVEADGQIKRIRRETIVGTKHDFPTEKLARRRADVILCRVNRHDYRPGKVIGFEEFVERWKEHAMPQQKPSSQRVACSHLRCYLLKTFGRLRLDEIGQEDVQQLVTALGKKLGRHTVNNILGTLFSILKTARQWGYVVSEIHQADLAISSARPSAAGKMLTAQQVTAILDKATDPWRTIFAVAAMTGMRPGEVLGLSVEDLDFDSKKIFIRRSAWRRELLTPKTKSSLGQVPMPAALEVILRKFLLSWKPNPRHLLFGTNRGNPYSRDKVVEKHLHPILDELKIPRCGMHAFRHGLASLLIANGATLKTAQEQLRHADPMTTARMYIHSVGDEQRSAAEKAAFILDGSGRKSQPNSILLN